MSTYRNLITLCFAAVFALGLAACGGGGSSPTTDGTDMMEPTPEAQIAALQQQINALRAELGLDPIDIDDLTGSVADLTQQVADLQKQIDDAADAEADRLDMENRATAAKLYAGIGAPMGGLTDTAATTRAAAYNDADYPESGDPADALIRVNIGDGTAADVTAADVTDLSEDKKTMVADNHGWTGKRYADAPGGDSYEAVVYSNVEDPTPGDKFGQIGVTTGATGYEYGLDANGILVADGGGAFTWVASRIASSSFDHSAGVKEFKLGTNMVQVMIPGTYHGVSGTYNCTPAASSTCAAEVAARGFNLGGTADADNALTAGGGTWTFKPSNPAAQVMSDPDTDYASYGWWLKKTENGKTFTASAFHDFKGTPGTVDIANLVGGTAKYMGGAAGKYALASSTGGTNDAGHFTARAMLEANFADDTISGTIDMFMGADGMERDWSVELKEAALANDGVITRAAANDTAWTIGGTAAGASGEWMGNLREEGTDGVPKAASGTFYTEYGTGGRMVGGFGANKQ